MNHSSVLFDDWAVRSEQEYNNRRRAYPIVISMILVFWLFFLVLAIWEWAVVFVLPVWTLVIVTVFLEWLKVKNNHLVIKTDKIEITNRFNKTTIYNTHIHELSLVLTPSFDRRSGGIIMKFYNANGKLICKYEDMINRAAPWGHEQTIWEKSLKGLGIKIIDATGIIKN